MSKSCSIILVGLVLSFASCSSYSIRKELESFLTQEVRFPSTLINCSDQYIGKSSLSDSIPKLVIYVDSTQCSSCRIGHLSEYISLQEESIQTGQFMLMIILSPPIADYGHIKHLLESYKYPLMIYLDKMHSFRQENDFIPDDTRFHSFLINRDRHPVLVGDPVRSEKLRRLFEESLQLM